MAAAGRFGPDPYPAAVRPRPTPSPRGSARARAAASTTASASASCVHRERPRRDRDDPQPVRPRARDVPRRVADDDRALARPSRPRRGRAIGGSSSRSSASEPKAPWPAGNQSPIPARASLSRAIALEVAGHQREAERVRAAAQRRQRLGHTRRQPRREVGRAQLVVELAARGDDVVGARVDRLRRVAGGDQQVAGDRRVGAARGLDVMRRRAPASRAPAISARAHRVGVLERGTLQQRAVDVPEQQERRRHRSNDTPASSRRANAASSRAVFSTSSICTISTGECM